MTHRLTTNYAKNCRNRTIIVKVIVENVVTCFLGHGVECRTASTTCDDGCAVTGRLQLNGAKTAFIWCAPPRRRHHIPSGGVQLGPDVEQPVQSARDLGVFMTMRTHINNVLSSCYGSLWQIRTIKRSLQCTFSTPSSKALYTVVWIIAISCSQDTQPATSSTMQSVISAAV